MANFIDRSPEEMMKYATDAKSILDDMSLTIRKVEGLLDAYASDLDGPTQAQIQKLHECCEEYFRQMEVYENIAASIYQKGKRLSEIRNGG